MRWHVVLALALTWALIQTQNGFAFFNNPVQGSHLDLQLEMEEIEPKILPDLEILWRGALLRNPTLQLALQKMAEKTGEKPKKNKSEWTEAILRNMVQLGGIGGAVALGNPAPIVGSTVISRATVKDKAAERLTEVTSADLVILAKEIEQAQANLLIQYVHYKQSKETVALLDEQLSRLTEQSKTLTENSPQLADTVRTLVVTTSLKREQARNQLETDRSLLILATSEATLNEVEQRNQTNPTSVPSDSGKIDP